MRLYNAKALGVLAAIGKKHCCKTKGIHGREFISALHFRPDGTVELTNGHQWARLPLDPSNPADWPHVLGGPWEGELLDDFCVDSALVDEFLRAAKLPAKPTLPIMACVAVEALGGRVRLTALPSLDAPAQAEFPRPDLDYPDLDGLGDCVRARGTAWASVCLTSDSVDWFARLFKVPGLKDWARFTLSMDSALVGVEIETTGITGEPGITAGLMRVRNRDDDDRGAFHWIARAFKAVHGRWFGEWVDQRHDMLEAAGLPNGTAKHSDAYHNEPMWKSARDAHYTTGLFPTPVKALERELHDMMIQGPFNLRDRDEIVSLIGLLIERVRRLDAVAQGDDPEPAEGLWVDANGPTDEPPGPAVDELVACPVDDGPVDLDMCDGCEHTGACDAERTARAPGRAT